MYISAVLFIYMVAFICNALLSTCATHKRGGYRQVSNIRRILVGNKIVDNSNVVGASPVGAAPTTSSFST